MAEAGRLKFVIEIDDKGLPIIKNINGEMVKLEKGTTDATGKMSKGFGAMWAQMALGQAAFALVQSGFRAITREIGSSIKMAIDAEETHSKFGTVFQTVAGQAAAASKELSDSWGVSKLASETMLSATGDLLTGLGLTGDAALDLSLQTQKLAIDLASFTNFSGGAQGASDALTKAMLGERESIKALGIVVTEEMVKEELMRVGKEKLTGMSLLQAKAEATLQIAMKQSANAMGDFARTQDSTANTIKTLTARFDDLKVEIGSAILEVAIPYLKQFAAWFAENKDEIIGTIKGIIDGFAGLVKAIVAFAEGVANSIPIVFKGWGLLLEYAAALREVSKQKERSAKIEQGVLETKDADINLMKQALMLHGKTLDATRAWGALAWENYDLAKKNILQGVYGNKVTEDYIRLRKETAGAAGKTAAAVIKSIPPTIAVTKATKDEIKALEELVKTQEMHTELLAKMPKPLATNAESYEQLAKAEDDAQHAAMEFYYAWLETLGIIPTTVKEIDTASKSTKKWTIDWQDANSVLEASRQMMDVVKQGLSDIGVELGPQAEAFMGVAEGAQIFVQGLIDKNPLTVIAGGIKMLTGIVKAFAGDGIGEAIKRENEWMRLNKELTKSLKELAKQMGDTHAATSVMLDDIIEEADITVANFSTYVYRVNEILSDYDRHTLSLSQTQKEIGDSFTALITKAKALGTEGSASILKLMDDLNNRGIRVKEIQDYINANWKAGLEGYKKYLEGDFSKATIGVFEYLLAYEKKVGANQALVDGIQGITQALIGMSNVTKLTEEEFDKFEMAGRDAYDKLIAQGFTSRESLMQLQPMLSRLIYLQKEYGLTIDAATQALIDKAKADGVDLSLVKSQDEVFGDMASSLAELVDIFRNVFPKAIDQTTIAFRKLNEAADNFNPDNTYNPKRPDEQPAATGWQGWVARGSNKRFLTGEPGGEDEYVSITPRSKMRGSDAPPGGGGAKTIINNFHLYNVITPENVAPAVKKAIIDNTQGLGSLLEK